MSLAEGDTRQRLAQEARTELTDEPVGFKQHVEGVNAAVCGVKKMTSSWSGIRPLAVALELLYRQSFMKRNRML